MIVGLNKYVKTFVYLGIYLKLVTCFSLNITTVIENWYVVDSLSLVLRDPSLSTSYCSLPVTK